MIGTMLLAAASAVALNNGALIDAPPTAPEGNCPQFYHVALQTGWTNDQWEQLDRLIYRESRCIPTACGVTDSPHLRKCRDWGLLQINDYSWKTKIRSMGLQMEDMHDPFWNLFFARVLFDVAELEYGCGWQPWSINCNK